MREEKAKYAITEEDLPRPLAKCRIVTWDRGGCQVLPVIQFLEPPPEKLLKQIGRFAVLTDVSRSNSGHKASTSAERQPDLWSEFSLDYSPLYDPDKVTNYICSVLISEYGEEILVNNKLLSD